MTEIVAWQPIALRIFLTVVAGVLIGFNRGGGRTDMLRGVTAAATLWFVTVIGLCFGGGQIVSASPARRLALPCWPEAPGTASGTREKRVVALAKADGVMQLQWKP